MAVKTLKDAPPELSIGIMEFFRRRMPDPLLIRIIVHFVFPAGIERKVTEAVRVEATRSLAEVGKDAAIPSLLYTLNDDSLAVTRAIDIHFLDFGLGLGAQLLDSDGDVLRHRFLPISLSALQQG